MSFKFNETSIDGLVVIEPHFYSDDRGYFIKDFEKVAFQKNNLPIDFFESNESQSKKGTIRGLHFQKKYPQGKLVRVIKGAVFDVAVDLRIGSKTFGKWEAVYLSSKNRKMLYIPENFAHGFLTLEDDTIFSYKCTNMYSPENESGILWNDKTLNIKWPIEQILCELILTDKDSKLPLFEDVVKMLCTNEVVI